MKFILALLLMTLSSAYADVQDLHCLPLESNGPEIEIHFHRKFNPLIPFIGRYELMSTLTVGDYTKTPVVVIPMYSYKNPRILHGRAGDDLGIRLEPEVINDTFTGNYTGSLFINDSDTRFYFRADINCIAK